MAKVLKSQVYLEVYLHKVTTTQEAEGSLVQVVLILVVVWDLELHNKI